MEINKILVAHELYKELKKNLSNKVQKEFRFLPEGKETYADFQWADAYVTFKAPANFDFAKIKWIHSLGAGVDGILNRPWKNDVLLTRTIASFGQKISEYCLSYIFRELQLHNKFEKSQQAKEWNIFEPIYLSSQKIVIFGTGVIGQEIAKNLNNFGADVCGVSLTGKLIEPFKKVVTSNLSGEVLIEADWIINTLPFTFQTKNFFNNSLFKYLTRACFINVGRGASLDEEALLEALEQNKLRLAVLDVFRDEPLPITSKLWNHPNIKITPHISAITSLDDAISCFLSTLKKVEAGIKPQNSVDRNRGY